MATVRFTDNIQRHVACPTREVSADTVHAALDAYFAENEQARDYVLDEHGSLRRHMVVFVDGRAIADRRELRDPVHDDAVIDVMQALSGG